MKIGINCGHTIEGAGYGAVGFIKESEQTRLVGYRLMDMLKAAGINVIDCTVDRAATQQEYLEKTVEIVNEKEADLFISIHFNASPSHSGNGTEVYTYRGRKHPEAVSICSSLSNIGLKNRGVKDGSGLYVIRKTKAKAILIEVCFCDNEKDVNIYLRSGAYEAAAQAIFKALSVPFDEFVGEIAHRDWIKRKIILPSVVTAQAIKESAWGKSELATQANALFGIKKNGWTGRTYIKTAVEQKADGSYYPVNNTEWRAYSSWEESIIDHNDYIATRTTDGGKTLRYAQIIGCEDYELTARGLQRCGYATSLTYADSLINDYIRKYNLLRFDEKI